MEAVLKLKVHRLYPGPVMILTLQLGGVMGRAGTGGVYR